VNFSSAADLGVLVVRCAVGVVFIAHGYNHVFGGGKIAGTAQWFESLGMRPGIVHAWLGSLTEIGAGVLLIAGLATPMACAGVVAVMVVAWITNHHKNGFFIFRPGEGYEYVMTLALTGFGLGAIGPGRWSLDYGLQLLYPPGWTGLMITAVGGLLTSTVLLATCWRPRANREACTEGRMSDE
jgi:putative oxidoreductase